MGALTTAGCRWTEVCCHSMDLGLVSLIILVPGLMYGQYMPIIMLTVATFTLIEAAGAADEYPALKGTSKVATKMDLAL